ncbi:MAG: phosphohistidine phosphatase [Streptomyces sp.]|jgi:phosphohistidine phosphatase|nr:phosphohistidine phosphatase [Streptomyces sp.]
MMAPGPRRLIVLRHAKSAWPDVDDHERPLGPRGLRDAPAAGRWLRDNDCVPDVAICSTARRTRETWDLVAAELGATPPAVFDERVYEASAAALLDVVRQAPDRPRTLLLVGHQPGVQQLVLTVAGEADGDALARAREKFPTSATAVLALPGTWADLAPGAAVLTDFAVPRGRKG